MTERNSVLQGAEQHGHDNGLEMSLAPLNNEQGEFRFRQWRIHYALMHPEGELVGPERPAEWELIGNREENRLDILARVWEGVPEAFRKILLYHETQEATLALGDAADYVTGGPKIGRLDISDAHQIATRLHRAYAEHILSPEEYEAFLVWDAQQNHF